VVASSLMATIDAATGLLEKICALPPEKVAEVEDFVDFLRARESDRHLVQAATKLSEEAFREVWDNAEDAAYDAL
jgi:hypothetical protein